MSQSFKLNVSPRVQTGRSASRRLRKVNRVPAVLYGKHSKPESLSIDVPEFIRLLKSVAGRTVLIELERPDQGEKALSFLQEVQRDAITDKYVHIDFQEVKADEKFEVRVSIRLTGESFGVKNQSGVLELNTQNLRVRTLPKDLPEAIVVDVSELKVGETIKISSLKEIPGVEFLDSPGQPIVSCVEPVGEIATDTVAATPSAGAAAPAAAATAAAAAAPAAGAKAAAPAAGAKPAAPAKK